MGSHNSLDSGSNVERKAFLLYNTVLEIMLDSFLGVSSYTYSVSIYIDTYHCLTHVPTPSQQEPASH